MDGQWSYDKRSHRLLLSVRCAPRTAAVVRRALDAALRLVLPPPDDELEVVSPEELEERP